MLKDLRAQYKSILQNPTGGKEPLKSSQVLEANADTIRRNSKYSAMYRSEKVLKVEAGPKIKAKRPEYGGEIVIKELEKGSGEQLEFDKKANNVE